MLTRTLCAALAVAASGEPEAPGICTWYGLNLPPIASMASYTAAWTTAMSRKLTGTGRGGAAFDTVSAAIAFQSSTASARATCHQLTAANTITGTVVIPFSHLFERVRDMRSSLSGRGIILPRGFCVQ